MEIKIGSKVMQVISLEEGKIRFSGDLVYKKSNIQEFETLKSNYDRVLSFSSITINGKEYKIRLPKVYSFSDNVICMSKCTGQNLELILRQQKTHSMGAVYLNSLFKYFVDNKFFWKDFAPRNIMIDNDIIYIMDFERGVGSEKLGLKEYLVDIVYEEYSAFLLPSERVIDVNSVYKSDDMSKVDFDSIKSRRVKNILKLTIGENVTYKDYLSAIKKIVVSETPYIENGQIKYPILELEEFMQKNGVEAYAKKIIGDSNGKERDI